MSTGPATGPSAKDVERALISKTVHSGAIDKLEAAGIHSAQFADKQCAGIFEICSEWKKRYKSAPTLTRVREKMREKDLGDFAFEIVQDSLDWWIEAFLSDVSRRVTLQELYRIAEKAGSGSRDECVNLAEEMAEAARRVMGAVPSQVVSSYRGMPSRKSDYEVRQKEGTPTGILMGIPVFDDLTFGIQPHEMVTVVGWQGTGKSTLMQYVCTNAYMQGFTPMIISLEMTAEQLWRKIDVAMMNAKRQAENLIKYRDMKALTLTDDELKHWDKVASEAENAKNDIIILDEIGRPTIDTVNSQMLRRRPDLVCIDYITLMEVPSRKDAANWETVTYLTKNLKRMARQNRIPILGVAQTNIESATEGARLQNIAFARSIGADSDMVFGLHQDEDMYKNMQMVVRMLKNRDGPRHEAQMWWDMEHMVFRPWDEMLDKFPMRRTSVEEQFGKPGEVAANGASASAGAGGEDRAGAASS